MTHIKRIYRYLSTRSKAKLSLAFGSNQSAAGQVFMHYVLELWVHQWRKRYARGRVIIVRYCDDFLIGFQFEADARRTLAKLKERLAKFKLVLK